MKTVENGDMVAVHYKGTFEDGTIFDSSHNREQPMMCEIGTGQLIPGFESALIGMTAGETKTVNLPWESAYGPRHEEAIIEVPKENFPEDFAFEVGLELSAQNEKGQRIKAMIVEVLDNSVVVDHNHPLAGKNLNFEIEIVKVGDTLY
jgi:peptidylprolyl isomerase